MGWHMSQHRILLFVLFLASCDSEKKPIPPVYAHCIDIPNQGDCIANTVIEGGGCQWLSDLKMCVKKYPHICGDIFEQNTCNTFTEINCLWFNNHCVDDTRSCILNGNPCAAASGSGGSEDQCNSYQVAGNSICTYVRNYFSSNDCNLNAGNPCATASRAQCGQDAFSLCIWQ